MKVSYRWLLDLLPGAALDPDELARRLALRGAPVDGVSEPWGALKEIVVGRVTETRTHPRADRLTLCTVDAGSGEPLSVVCGAPNVEVDAFFPFAPVGSILPGGVKLKRARIRGESSHGMLCSPRELGLGDDHSGILRMEGEHEPGAGFIEAAGLDDLTLDVEITANRGDLLSHLGIARELATDTSGPPELPPLSGAGDLSLEWKRSPSEPSTRPRPTEVSAAGVSISVEEPELCPRYVGAVVRGVEVGPSPGWLRRRLAAAGSRPVNNVVDATNYVLLELGHPLHAFDLGKLRGSAVRVRTPRIDTGAGAGIPATRAGESRFTTLDGEERSLDDSMLMICDAEGPVAVAGVIGGRDSAVGDDTTEILLECALFDPRSVRRTRRALGLSTDASYRFERGVDPTGVRDAVERALSLILAVAGGEVTGPVLDCAPVPFEPTSIELRPARIERLLGVPFATNKVRKLLHPLGFTVGEERSGRVAVEVPGFRSHDVTREVDLIEEIARTWGFDRFPDDLGSFRPSTVPDDPFFRFEDEIRDELDARGLLEIQSPAFVSEAEGEVRLQNPLTAPEPVVRRDILPSVLRTVERNFALGNRDLRLFELATSFSAPPQEGAPPREETRLAAVVTGRKSPTHWSTESSALDFDCWDLKGLLFDVARMVWGAEARVEPENRLPPSGFADRFAPDRTFAVRSATDVKDVLGAGGLVTGLDAPAKAGEVWAFELALPERPVRSGTPVAAEISPYPASERDLALTVPDEIDFAAVQESIVGYAGDLLESLVLFDRYKGSSLTGSDRSSLAFRLRFRSPKRTLKDREVDRYVARVLKALERLDVEQRS